MNRSDLKKISDNYWEQRKKVSDNQKLIKKRLKKGHDTLISLILEKAEKTAKKGEYSMNYKIELGWDTYQMDENLSLLYSAEKVKKTLSEVYGFHVKVIDFHFDAETVEISWAED